MKRFFARAKALLPCIALGLGFARSASAQPPIITNYNDLRAAVSRGGMSIFASNDTVTLSGGAETLLVTTAVVLNASTNHDGTTNTATINRASGTGPIFLVLPGGSLTLVNLTISGGLNTNGGAIFNYADGTLILSNCLFTANSATNFAGVTGLNATSQGDINGGNGGSGMGAAGGAITSQGVLKVYYSIFDNNSVQGGNGGNGGNGIKSFVFGGNGGNGGNGGGAQGGAIVCSGPTNIFVASAFTGNHCTAGTGGSAGTPASGSFSGNPGSGGVGGSSVGGAILASGPVCMTNCLFSGNSAVAGGTSSFGKSGGVAVGGGVSLTSSTNTAIIENTTFNQNSCQGGAGGGNSGLVFHPAGNGGSAVGGGLASAAALTVVRNCTLATNTLTGGTAGVSSTTESNGLPGLTLGFDLARTAGTLKMAGSILSGGTNATATNFLTLTLTTYITNTTPNDSGGLTDLGYNFSSDTSVALLSSLGSIVNTNPFLDTSLSSPGNTVVGLLSGSPGQTLAVLFGSPAIGAVPGIPGHTFPAYDQVFQPRSSPTTMGAYEANPLDLTTATRPTIVTPPSDFATNAGGAAIFQVTAVAGSTPLGYQWQFNGTNLADSSRISGAWSNILTIKSVTTNDIGSYSVLVGASTLIAGGVVSSQTNVLTVFVPVTIQTQPPRTVKPVPGTPLNLFVVASGAAPLTFQ
ncbi:MAG: immunoglobulin domain-containing protein, partial [Verrucomicrobiota bacterium]